MREGLHMTQQASERNLADAVDDDDHKSFARLVAATMGELWSPLPPLCSMRSRLSPRGGDIGLAASGRQCACAP